MTRGDGTGPMGVDGGLVNEFSQGGIGDGKELENATNVNHLESSVSLEYEARKRELKNAWFRSLVNKNSW